jgi:arginyl-tRNA--protein-N-Asp/Glu arginylyltransferase
MYLAWNEKTMTDFSDESIESAYNNGYVLTRIGKGTMKQTRNIRIDLRQFELSSENKRILKKTEDLLLSISPIPYSEYTWNIHKMGKDFYEQKFGSKTFSAQKIKELMTDSEKSNFNRVFTYRLPAIILSTAKNPLNTDEKDPSISQPDCAGYCIALETKNFLHYCYPFYNLDLNYPNLGMGMMLKAIVWAKENNKQYIYLGSAQRPTDTYKLQFAGLEWFDGKTWQTNTGELKTILNNLKTEN